MAARNAAFAIKVEPAGDRLVKFTASTNGVDRHGTRLLPSGCRYENYLKNPVFLWNHRKHEEAEPDDVIGRAVSVKVLPGAVEITVEFDTAPKADRCLQLVRRNMLRAVSIGFIPLVEHPRFNTPQDAEAFLARGGVIEVREWELCELSLTIVPSNPDALKTRGFALRAPAKVWEVAAMMVHRPDGATLWGRRRDSGLYTTPAGRLNPGEAPEAGAARELFEEAGLRADKMQKLGVAKNPRANVHCFRVDVSADAQPTSENDPDREVARWEWLATFPPAAEQHHKPNSLLPYYEGVVAKAARTYSNERVEIPKTDLSRGFMDPKVIFDKLGITEGVKPEECAAALIKYLAGPDSDADKQALVLGLLSMLVPAQSAASEGGEGAALEAMADEVRKLQARVVELEGAKVEAEKKAEPTPEQRADEAIRSGRWPDGQRSVLVDCLTNKKPVHLFAEKTFATRSTNFTAGGNPIAGRAPTFEQPAVKSAGAKSIFAEVSERLGRSNGTN